MVETVEQSAFEKWRNRLGPELSRTAQRFPVSICFVIVATTLYLVELNAPDASGGSFLGKSFATFSLSALLAVATQLMVESGVIKRTVSWTLDIVGFVLIGITLFGSSKIIGLPIMWVPLLILLTSISPTLAPKAEAGAQKQQELFWWMNHRSIVSAMIAGLAFLVILFGLMIIERSVAILFGFEIDKLIYRFLVPLAGLLFAPIYWLVTIPELEDYRAQDMENPDFLSGAVGFLGLYIFAPFLALYTLILIAYAVQILIQQSYPEGTVGWMVIGFIAVAGLNHLLLFPQFMRKKPFVARYLRLWPLFAVIPVIMLSFAIYIRISHYGLTPERILLGAGTVWTIIIIAMGAINRLDIRLLPALAAILLLPISFGPFNMENWSQLNQLSRFEQNLEIWKESQDKAAAQRINGAANYLLKSGSGRTLLTQKLQSKGVEIEGEVSREKLAETLDLPNLIPDLGTRNDFLRLDDSSPINLSGALAFYGHVQVPCCGQSAGGYSFSLKNNNLQVEQGNLLIHSLDLRPWIAAQNLAVTKLRERSIEIVMEGKTYILYVDEANLEREPDDSFRVTRLNFYLFAKTGSDAD
jgi:hypothetical protein